MICVRRPESVGDSVMIIRNQNIRTLEHMVRIRETFHQFPVYSDKDTSEREDRFSGVFCRYLGDYKLTMKPKQGIMSEGIKRKNKEIKETKRNEERYQCRNF